MKKLETPPDLEELRAARELARSLEEGGPADPGALEAVRILRAAGGEPSPEELRAIGDELFPPRRRRWPLLAAAAAVLVIATSIGVPLSMRREAPTDLHARAERAVAALQRADTPAARAELIAREARR